MRDDFNIIPVSLAIVLHVAMLVVMVVAFDFSKSSRPPIPLAITGQLVSIDELPRQSLPEPVPDPEPEPEPEPEPPVEEPPVVEPEPTVDPEQERRALEEQKRLEDQRAEEQRKQQIAKREEEARIQREQEAERKRQEQAEAERKQQEEAEKERQRVETERKRAEEVARKQAENERKRREAEEAERKRRLATELAEESSRLEAMDSGEMARYLFAIQQKIQRNWVQPPSAHAGIECVALVRQLPGGEVIGVRIDTCNGDPAVQRSIEAAIYKASPLPQPANRALFDRNLRITVKPEQ